MQTSPKTHQNYAQVTPNQPTLTFFFLKSEYLRSRSGNPPLVDFENMEFCTSLIEHPCARQHWRGSGSE